MQRHKKQDAWDHENEKANSIARYPMTASMMLAYILFLFMACSVLIGCAITTYPDGARSYGLDPGFVELIHESDIQGKDLIALYEYRLARLDKEAETARGERRERLDYEREILRDILYILVTREDQR
jgi:hypothetical protein